MNTEAGLLAAIWDEPHADVHRLVYADWLEDHGEAEEHARAELIRAQCTLANIPGNDPRYDALEARVRQILKQWQRGWWQHLPVGCRLGHFDRGFPVPTLQRFRVPGLVELDERRLQAAPLWKFHIVPAGYLGTLLAWPFLHRLERFYLLRNAGDAEPAELVQQVIECPGLCNLTHLGLRCAVAPGDLTRLLDSWSGRPLVQLNVDLTPEGFRVLADHPAAAGLRRLALSDYRVRLSSIDALGPGEHLRRLLYLDLRGVPLGEADLARLLRWPPIPSVRTLGLADTGMNDATTAQFAAAPVLANLRQLFLGGNRIGEAGAVALAESPHLRRLEVVNLVGNPVASLPTVVARLGERFGRALGI